MQWKNRNLIKHNINELFKLSRLVANCLRVLEEGNEYVLFNLKETITDLVCVTVKAIINKPKP